MYECSARRCTDVDWTALRCIDVKCTARRCTGRRCTVVDCTARRRIDVSPPPLKNTKMQKQIPGPEPTTQRPAPQTTQLCERQGARLYTSLYTIQFQRKKQKKSKKTNFFKWNSGETSAPGALGLDAPTAVEIKQNPQPAAELRSKMSEKIASESDPCPSPEKLISKKTLCYTDHSRFIYPTTPSEPKMNDPSSRNRLLNDIAKTVNTKSR